MQTLYNPTKAHHSLPLSARKANMYPHLPAIFYYILNVCLIGKSTFAVLTTSPLFVIIHVHFSSLNNILMSLLYILVVWTSESMSLVHTVKQDKEIWKVKTAFYILFCFFFNLVAFEQQLLYLYSPIVQKL